MRRVVLATWFPEDPACPSGGVEAVSLVLARALARHGGIEVHVVTVGGRCGGVRVAPWEGVTVHRLPRGDGPLLRYALGPGRERIKRYIEGLEAGLVHSHDTFGIMTMGMKVPRVFTIHGFIHEDVRHGGGVGWRLRAMMWRRAEFAAWGEQPHIISISPYVRERLNGVARGVIHDIENPVDENWFGIERREEPGVVLCAAVVCPRKNQLGLAEAFARTDGRELVLAGPVGDEAYAEALRRFIRAKHLGGRIHLVGSLAHGRLQDEYARCAAFVLPSFEEGAPMGIAEAMAAGVPVIASNRCGMPYMIRDGETGMLVDPGSVDGLAGCLERLLLDARGRVEMGRAAREFALSSYHPERVARRTLRAYDACGMVESSPRGGM